MPVNGGERRSEMAGKRVPNADKGQFRSGEEAAKAGRKGGKASGEARRAKKSLRECLELLMEKDITDENGDTVSGAEAISAKLFQAALRGDLKAFEIVRDTTGQKPVEKVVVSDVDPLVIAEIEEMVSDGE